MIYSLKGIKIFYGTGIEKSNDGKRSAKTPGPPPLKVFLSFTFIAYGFQSLQELQKQTLGDLTDSEFSGLLQ